MLAKFIDENNIEVFNNIYFGEEPVELEDGSTELVSMVYTNAAAEEKALAGGEWLEVVEAELPADNRVYRTEYSLENNKIYKNYTVI